MSENFNFHYFEVVEVVNCMGHKCTRVGGYPTLSNVFKELPHELDNELLLFQRTEGIL